jgi:hypothetical protein
MNAVASRPGVLVRLTWSEVMLAGEAGLMRQVDNLKNGRRQTFAIPDPEEEWRRDIEGACAEMAFAKFGDRFWSGAIGNFKVADVGPFEVRSTGYENGCLPINKKNNPDRLFILAVGRAPVFRLAGWIKGSDAQRVEWWREPPAVPFAAWFVPQANLHPMDSLELGKDA